MTLLFSSWTFYFLHCPSVFFMALLFTSCVFETLSCRIHGSSVFFMAISKCISSPCTQNTNKPDSSTTNKPRPEPEPEPRSFCINTRENNNGVSRTTVLARKHNYKCLKLPELQRAQVEQCSRLHCILHSLALLLLKHRLPRQTVRL
jgi:hypothetical protein